MSCTGAGTGWKSASRGSFALMDSDTPVHRDTSARTCINNNQLPRLCGVVFVYSPIPSGPAGCVSLT